MARFELAGRAAPGRKGCAGLSRCPWISRRVRSWSGIPSRGRYSIVMTRVSVIPPKPTASECLIARGAEFVATSPEARADALESTPWSRRLSWKQEEGIGHYFRSFRLPALTVLFREGDHDAFLAIVITGALEIQKNDADERSHVMARLGRGKMVGQMSVVDGAARSATAVASEVTELLVMSRDDFDRMCEAQPELALTFALMIAEAIAQLLRQTTGRMVDHLED